MHAFVTHLEAQACDCHDDLCRRSVERAHGQSRGDGWVFEVLNTGGRRFLLHHDGLVSQGG